MSNVELKGLRELAISLYKPPFKFVHGYIYDAAGNMVADEGGENAYLRVRGWGRISYMENPEQLQDMAGGLIAEALTKQWEALSSPSIPPAGEEPVGHVNMRGKAGCGDRIKWTGWAMPHGTALYAAPIASTAPAESAPKAEMTDEEILKIAASVWSTIPAEWWERDRNEISAHCIAFARAIRGEES